MVQTGKEALITIDTSSNPERSACWLKVKAGKDELSELVYYKRDIELCRFWEVTQHDSEKSEQVSCLDAEWSDENAKQRRK